MSGTPPAADPGGRTGRDRQAAATASRGRLPHGHAEAIAERAGLSRSRSTGTSPARKSCSAWSWSGPSTASRRGSSDHRRAAPADETCAASSITRSAAAEHLAFPDRVLQRGERAAAPMRRERPGQAGLISGHHPGRPGGRAGRPTARPAAQLVVFGLLGMCNWLHKWYRPDGKRTPTEIADVFVALLERAPWPTAAHGSPDDARWPGSIDAGPPESVPVPAGRRPAARAPRPPLTSRHRSGAPPDQ